MTARGTHLSCDEPDCRGDRPEKVSDEVVTYAKQAFRQRAEGAVATLVFDSLVDDGHLAEHHPLRFEPCLMQIDLQVSVEASGSSVRGTVNPPTAVRAEVQFSTAEISLIKDATDVAFWLRDISHAVIPLAAAGQAGCRSSTRIGSGSDRADLSPIRVWLQSSWISSTGVRGLLGSGSAHFPSQTGFSKRLSAASTRSRTRLHTDAIRPSRAVSQYPALN